MEQRLGRTVRVFLVVMAAAGFYRLAVVPWVEPRIRDPQAELALSPEQAAAIRARADRRLAALGDVFPPGSWEREDPIMLESRQMRLLFKEYHALPDGRVNLVPCTLVVLPDRNRSVTDGTGRTLVLRAPRGAVLEFDEPLDLKQGRLAKLVGGSLRGQVTIRGPATAPGVEDDIEIVTRDIELDELQVQTVETVQFRYGRSTGSGRGLVVRLMPRQGSAEHEPATQRSEGQGPNIGGVESVRIDRDVRMRLEGLSGGLLPGRPAPAAQPPAAEGQGEPAPPVLVSCRGSLCFNVAADVITLEDKVEVVRTGTQSGTDHLSCDLLAILLGRRATPPAGADGSTAGTPRGPLEPTEIQAKGAPVVARSAHAGLEARAARLGYEIATRRIVLDGDDPVSLVVRTTEMEARKIDYCPAPAGGPGALMAVGPGRLTSRPERGGPARARWQQWLRMRPDGAGHVLSLAGDAEVAVEGQGRLAGSELHLWLDAVAGPVAPAAAAAGPDLSGLRPARMLARGMVEVDADRIEARTDRLELWFRQVAAAAGPAAAGGGPAAPVPAAPVERGRPGGRLAASAALVRGLVVMGPGGNELEEMSMEGQVRLVEQAAVAPAPGVPPAEPGLEVVGDQMQVSRAAGPDARAIVSGRPARVHGRGLDLTGPLVEFDRGRGRITVDGAGRLTLPMTRGAGGLDLLGFASAAPAAAPPAAGPEKLDVTWQGRMDFDGRTARFVDRVVTTSGAAAVKAGSIDVVFDQPFDLGGAPRPGARQPEVMKVACGGGVHVESESRAEDGGRSRDRLHARDLVIDRITGDVSGTGPGRLLSTRLGTPPLAAPSVGPPGPMAQAVSAPRSAPGLTYLGVDFQRGLRGNLHRRTMEFHQRVEAIWGPVAAWDDTLDIHAAAGLPEGVVTVSCDVLGVGQVPAAPGGTRPTIELAAAGNVLVEGESFTGRSARLTWAEAKDLLVFEGDGRSDAQLFRQLQAGAQPSSASAGKILLWRGQNRVDVEDARYLDLDQLRGGTGANLPAPPPARGPAGPPARPLPST